MIHFAVNVETKEVVAMDATTDDVRDSKLFCNILNMAEENDDISKVYGDGTRIWFFWNAGPPVDVNAYAYACAVHLWRHLATRTSQLGAAAFSAHTLEFEGRTEDNLGN